MELARESRGDKAKGAFTRCRNRGGNISLFQEFSNYSELYVLLVEMMSFFFLRATKSNIVSSKNSFSCHIFCKFSREI